jgi:magnesium transporter
MLNAYAIADNVLVCHPADADQTVLAASMWLDLVEPTPDEEKRVETALGIDIPTRGELEEIEASSRLYQDDDAIFMTATLIRRGDYDRPEASPVTFVVKGKQLITIRYHHPQAFPVYVKQAMRHVTAHSSWGIFISLVEAVIDRAADHLERAGVIIDDTSKQVFSTSLIKRREEARKRRKPKNLEELLSQVGEEGDFTSKMRESLVSVGRMVAYAQSIVDQTRDTKEGKDNKARLKTLQRDILSLTDHASFLSAKISFLLDAVLGMISIEQNAIIKIFTIASVVFLPPTLVASIYGMNFKMMPELDWEWGYPFGVALMVMSALAPVLWFKRRGWL